MSFIFDPRYGVNSYDLSFLTEWNSSIVAVGDETPFSTPLSSSDVVAYWDAGSGSFPTYGIKGGYDFVFTDNDYFNRLYTTVPCFSAGVPQYPFSVIVWCKTNSIAVNNYGTLFSLDIGNGFTNRVMLYRLDDDIILQRRGGGGTAASAVASTSFGAVGRWTCVIAVLASASSASVYTDFNTTGATNSSTRTIVGINSLWIGRNTDVNEKWDGEIAYTAFLPVDLSGPGNATKRQYIFNGSDPELITGVTATAIYHLDNDSGVDAKGNFSLTAGGTPVAKNNLIVLRDKVSPSGHHMRATNSAPTWSSGAYNGRGGALFEESFLQHLECLSTPVTVAPFQCYAIASASGVTKRYTVLGIGSSSDQDWWNLYFAGSTAIDPIQFSVRDMDNSPVSADVYTSTGFTANTTKLLWVMEENSTSRYARLDGIGQGTNTSNLTPDNLIYMRLGAIGHTSQALFLGGSIGAIWIKNSTDITDRTNAHNWVNSQFGTTIV